MVYTDSQKRRDTKDKWRRREARCLDEAKEMRAFRDQVFKKMGENHKERDRVHMELTHLVGDLDDTAYQYRWLIDNLSGG